MSAVSYDPYSPEVTSDRYSLDRELRATAPVHRVERSDARALPRFEDVWQVAQDRENFSIVEGPVFAKPRVETRDDGAPDARLTTPVRSLSMVAPFTPRATAPLEADVRAVAGRVIAPLAEQGRFDVHHDYGAPLAAAVRFRVLGLPEDDRPHLVDLANRFVRRDDGRPGVGEAGLAAHQELEVDGERRRLTPVEIANQLTTLLVGGIDPDEFRIGRAAPRHLGFGHGVHLRIGAHTARLEGVVLLQALLAAVPEYAVDHSALERRPSEFQLGDTPVPIEFDPR